MHLAAADLVFLPEVLQEPPDAPIVLAIRAAPGFFSCIVSAGRASRCTVLAELVQRVRPVVEVAELEIRIARMVGDRAPVLRVLHAEHDRAVTAGGFAEAAAMLASRQGAELA